MLIKDIEKMEAYTPTEYVNDSEPDLDADNLNKTERQLRDTVAKANEIIDTLKSLISNVSVNSEDTVPSSAVAYKMEQDIEQLNSNIQSGYITVRSKKAENVTFSVTFPKQFSKIPQVALSVGTSAPKDNMVSITSVDENGFTGTLWRNADPADMTVRWIAVN